MPTHLHALNALSCLALIFLTAGCASSPLADGGTESSRAAATHEPSARSSESTVPAPTRVPSTVVIVPTHTSALTPAPPTPFSPPAVSLDDAAAELLADTDPSLHLRLEISRTIPMSTLWEHEGWQKHEAQYGQPMTLSAGRATNVGWSDRKQLAHLETRSPLAHLLVFSVDDPSFDPYPAQRWSSCPIRPGEPEVVRGVQVVVLDTERAGWTQAAVQFCAGTLDDIVAEMSALPTADVRPGQPAPRPTPKQSATRAVTASVTAQAPTASPSRTSVLSTAVAGAKATSDPATANTLRALGLRQGAWWRYRYRSRWEEIGGVPDWWRGSVYRRVRSVSLDPRGGYLVEFEEEVTRADNTVASAPMLLSQPPLYVVGHDVETVYEQDGELRLASEVAAPLAAKFGNLAVPLGSIAFYPPIEIVSPGSWESESIAVPMHVIAGEFEGCHRLEGYSMGHSISQIYCPEVGLVRQVFGVGRGWASARDWLELETYDVRGE